MPCPNHSWVNPIKTRSVGSGNNDLEHNDSSCATEIYIHLSSPVPSPGCTHGVHAAPYTYAYLTLIPINTKVTHGHLPHSPKVNKPPVTIVPWLPACLLRMASQTAPNLVCLALAYHREVRPPPDQMGGHLTLPKPYQSRDTRAENTWRGIDPRYRTMERILPTSRPDRVR